MNLLDKYVNEVGKHLSRKSRPDIEAEIRSTLQDMLEDRSEHSGKPIDDAMTVEVLREFGAPDKVAASYVGAKYLIGPRLYPIFILVVQIVIAVLFGVGIFGLIASGAFAKPFMGNEFLSFFGKFWAEMIGGMITAFGNIVIIFAILERVIPASEFEKGEEKTWDPAQLAREPDPDQVETGEMIATIIFTSIALVILNLYPDLVGMYFTVGGNWVFVPALSDAFFTYLPWINLLGVLQIIFSLFMLRETMWKTWTRIINILLEVGTIALATAMLMGPALIDLTSEMLTGTPAGEAAEVLIPILNIVPVIVLAIIIVLSSIEIVKTVYKLIKGRPAPYNPVK
jgi:hypothetical protein